MVRKYIFIIILVLIQIQVISQCMLIEVPLEQMALESKAIFEGEVIQTTCHWDSEKSMIYTLNKIRVSKTFKGRNEQILSLLTKGGVIGLRKIEVEPELKLEAGMKGIFMAKKANLSLEGINQNEYLISDYHGQSFFNYDEATGRVQGSFITAEKDDFSRSLESITGKKAIENYKLTFQRIVQLTRAVTSFSPTTITAGTKSVLTINGSGFGAVQGTLQFTHASFPTTPNPTYGVVNSFDILSWSDNLITVEVPSFAGTGLFKVFPNGSGTSMNSATNINIISAQTTVVSGSTTYKTRHSNVSNNSKIIFTLNTSFNSNTSAKESFTRALNTWRCNNNANLGIDAATTTIATSSDDDVNVIYSSNISSLGVTTTYFNGCTIGGLLYWHTTEMDIAFTNSGSISWYYGTGNPGGTQYDFQSVAIHEIGHALLLSHIIDNNKVMHYAIGNGQTRRVISADETAAMADVLSRGVVNTNMCGFFPISYAPNATVSNTNASGAGSLLQAVQDVCENDTIVFTVAASSTIVVSPEITIDKSMKIIGLSQTTFSLSGNNANRIFNISSGKTLWLQTLRLINSTATTNGGAFLNNGTVNLKNVTFVNNLENGNRKAFTSPVGSMVNNELSVQIKL